MKPFNYLIILGTLLFAVFAGDVFAHLMPSYAEPKVGAVINQSPKRVLIRFDGALDHSSCVIRVLNDKGEQIDNRDVHVDHSDESLIQASLPPIPPGRYRVIWSVAGHDGHRTKGDYSFTVK